MRCGGDFGCEQDDDDDGEVGYDEDDDEHEDDDEEGEEEDAEDHDGNAWCSTFALTRVSITRSSNKRSMKGSMTISGFVYKPVSILWVQCSGL